MGGAVKLSDDLDVGIRGLELIEQTLPQLGLGGIGAEVVGQSYLASLAHHLRCATRGVCRERGESAESGPGERGAGSGLRGQAQKILARGALARHAARGGPRGGIVACTQCMYCIVMCGHRLCSLKLMNP